MSVRQDVVVYVAGPISRGPLTHNIEQACHAGMALLKAGLSPHVPQLTCFMGMRPYPGGGGYFYPEVLPCGTVHEDWYEMDLAFVRRSDCVLRLPGESTGADLEVAEAVKGGIPVFYTVEAVLAWAEGR